MSIEIIKTWEEFLALTASLVPDWYLEQFGLLTDEDETQGAEIIRAFSAVFERCGRAAERILSELLPSTASFKAYAETTLQIRVQDPDEEDPSGTYTLQAGSLFRQDGGIPFETLEDVELQAPSEDPGYTEVAARSLWPLYCEHPENTIVYPVRLLWDPAPTTEIIEAKVVGSSVPTGGTFPGLNILGKTRNISPADQETVALFRERFARLTEVLTPSAIIDACQALIRDVTSEEVIAVEPWQMRWTFGRSYFGRRDTGVMMKGNSYYRHFLLVFPTTPVSANPLRFWLGNGGFFSHCFLGYGDPVFAGFLKGMIQMVNRLRLPGVSWRFLIADRADTDWPDWWLAEGLDI